IFYQVIGGWANNANALWSHPPSFSQGFHHFSGGFTLEALGKLSTRSGGEVTIASGEITATASHHRVDTESDAASDDLDTINGGEDGDILVLQPQDSSRTVVAKDGTGNLQLAGDFAMAGDQATLVLQYHAAQSEWVELSRTAHVATVTYNILNAEADRSFNANSTD